MVLVRIYLFVIVVLVIAYMVFYTHRKRIAKTLTMQVDKMIYLYDKTIYMNQQRIFDYDATKPLLFHNQQNFFKNGKDYTQLFPLLLQDIHYIESLIQKKIVSQENIQSIVDTYGVEQKLYTLKHYTYIILIILTLGIGKLFLP